MTANKNTLALAVGLLIGLICPLFVILGNYFLKNQIYTFADFITVSYQSEMLAKQLSLGTILNLGAFMLLVNLKKIPLGYARGILIATIVYGAFIIYLKFLA